MGHDLRRRTRERHERLLTLVRSGTTQVEALADALRVSPSTVRRDLQHLGAAGALTRTYGGATAGGPFHERELSERMTVETEAKAAIGRRAADRVPDGGTIFVDAGSTCAELAARLHGRTGLTVLTRGLEIAIMLAGEPGIDVVIVGGSVAKKSHGLVGPLTTLALERVVLDVAFLGVDAVDPVDGVGEPTLVEAQVKEAAARRAREVVVLADATKLHRGNVPAWAPLPAGWTLVTNASSEALLGPYREANVEILTVSPEGWRTSQAS